MRRHKITHITPGGIGESLGLEAGDFLLEIDGHTVHDVFDYRMMIQAEELTVLIEKEGELWELDIEKDAGRDLGLTFESPLMDEIRLCRNRCVFCFIDQQPPGLRGSLYVKDDDPRLSFLHGNYITLTNINEAETERIARYHLSPLRISVHTTNAALRCKMMGNPNAGNLFAALERFNNAGIEMHFQAVICKGINDGTLLDETIKKLLAYKPGAASLAVVPAGLTKHRHGLAPVAPLTAGDALAVIAQIEAWQKKCRARYGSAFVYAADEWYILADLPVPGYKSYGGFPQLDNGVGMLALFKRGFEKGMKTVGAAHTRELLKKFDQNVNIGVVTGAAAFRFMRGLAESFIKRYKNMQIQVFSIVNDFFGEAVTVSGLLTGGDVIRQMQGKCGGLDVLFLPRNAFREGTEIMPDGVTRGELADALGADVRIGSADGEVFCKELLFVQTSVNKV
jgi:putative radical SAM enzyme (TIGR03279 family)